MIHHMSFSVRSPERVAHILAELTGATAVKAPTPPFPLGTWFVVAGDEKGSLLEILPAAFVFDPAAPLGFSQRPPTFKPVAAHVLVSAAVEADAIRLVAMREGWRLDEVETGLFKVIKVWIEECALIEFLADGEAARYVDSFGTPGLSSLDERLRDLEVKMTAALSSKLPPHVLDAALGRTPAS